MFSKVVGSAGGRKFILAILALFAAVAIHVAGKELTDNLLYFLLGITGIYGTVNVSKGYVDKKQGSDLEAAPQSVEVTKVLEDHEKSMLMLANRQEELYNVVINSIGGNNGTKSNASDVYGGQQG